jgi:sn-glycerol 3-phosphate transport system substrate-binding protein
MLGLMMAGLAASPAIAPAIAQAQDKKPIELQFWHGLTGPAVEMFARYADDFNKSQSEYKVNVAFKGQYPEQRAAAIAAFRAGNPPHVMQMFDAGSGDMMSARSAIVPVSDVFQKGGLTFDPASFIAPARGYYGLPDGRLLSMPFNVSTTILFYNKDAFAKAGLNPDKAPATAKDPGTMRAAAVVNDLVISTYDLDQRVKLMMVTSGAQGADAAKKLRASGQPCGFTTTWLAWVMLEQFGSRHNLALSTEANGRGSLKAELNFNTPPFVRMVQTLVDAQKDKSFDYGGRSNDAAAKFISGECAMMTQSSGGWGAIQRDAKFQFGAGALPYWPDVASEPYATTIGGASLWVFNAPNRSAAEFKGIALFMNHLASVPVMTDWVKGTGFLPATVAAFDALKAEGYYEKNPGRDVPIKSLMEGKQGDNSQGYRFGRWTEIRDFYHEEVERALQGQQSAQAALDNAVKRGNAALRQFEQTAAN